MFIIPQYRQISIINLYFFVKFDYFIEIFTVAPGILNCVASIYLTFENQSISYAFIITGQMNQKCTIHRIVMEVEKRIKTKRN